MKNFFWAVIFLFIIGIMAVWPPTRGAWQESIGWSAFYFGQSAQELTDKTMALVRLVEIDKQLKSVEKENASLKAEIASLQKLKTENEKLRKIINLKRTSDYDVLATSRVIGRSPANFLQTITIDAGSDDGVEVNQTVISEGYLVGQVKSVTPRTSEVNVITSGNLLLPVVMEESRGSGMVRGGLEGLIVEEISLDAEIKQNELVATQDLGNIVVSGIAVGTIREVSHQKGDIFQKAIIDSPLDFNRLEIVEIINNQ